MASLDTCTLILLLCVNTVFICQIQIDASGCIDSERDALLDFKSSLVDDANRLSSWNINGKDCCTWYGISCNNQTGHIERLDLHNPIQPYVDRYSYSDNSDYYYANCLGGDINPSLQNLKHLNYLDLSSNYFSGTQIPTFFGSLKNLRYLNLSNAGFRGEIPSHLGNLSNLQYLYIGQSTFGFSDNSLTAKSLWWITGLSSLKALDLSGTNLSLSLDWLDSVNMLPSLSSLTLWNCQLVGKVRFPLAHFNLTSLVSLDIGKNHLNSTSPFKSFNLTSKLEVLRINDNDLAGPIPFVLEKLTSLVVLDLSGNSFHSSSILLSLCNLTSLVYTDLSGNQFEGSLPLCIGNVTFLRQFYLEKNKFGGKIPSELGHLKQLIALDLSDNSFISSIPTSFGKLTELVSLYLGRNQLYGTVPSTMGNLTKLRDFHISHNSLTGELSESYFMKLSCLKSLYISNNQFLTLNVSSLWIPPFQLVHVGMDSVHVGTHFPPWLRTQKNVNFLSMRNASISGPIPEWFGTMCSSVEVLHLSDNKINGSLMSLPPSIVGLFLSNNLLTGLFDANDTTYPPLQVILSDNNHLTGNIPEYLCNLSSLVVISLANNQLTGRIPLCFGNLLQLQMLNLANNSLSGHIPSILGTLDQLLSLHLNGNKFSGVIPSSFKNLTLLRALDLGENHLKDTIPNWIGKELSSLMFLRLELNKFYGNISLSLCQLSCLQILNLAQNNLVGTIPHCLGNLSMMLSTVRGTDYADFGYYTDVLLNTMKGTEREYSPTILQYVRFISLSGNRLRGEIPNELMDLEGLQSLNLSNNNLSGKIPEKIDNLKLLESLDLSINQLYGPIPQNLANIDFLSYLNLSFNNLEGRIPSGNHFDTLNDPSIYEGNSGLCGKPLPKSCPDDSPSKENGAASNQRNGDDKGLELPWFYAGIGPGFSVGLLGVLSVLCFKKSWRHTYFGFLENVYTRVWVAFAVKISQLKRKFM